MTTESVWQLCLKCYIVREYGLSPNLYEKVTFLMSLFMSIISIVLSFSKVSSNFLLYVYVSNLFCIITIEKLPLQRQADMIDGWSTWKALLYWFLPLTAYMVCIYLIAFSRESFVYLTFAQASIIHPLFALSFAAVCTWISGFLAKYEYHILKNIL